MVIFLKPVDIWDAAFIVHYLIGEVAGRLTEVVFGGGQDAPLFIAGIGSDDEATAGGGDDADGTGTTIERMSCIPPGEVADHQDGTAGPFSELGQGSEDFSHALVTRGVDGVSEHGHEGIDDDQNSLHALDGVF